MKPSSQLLLLPLVITVGCSPTLDNSLSNRARTGLANAKPTDILEIEFIGEHLRQKAIPGKYDDPVIERDPAKIAEILKAFQSAAATVVVPGHGGEVPDEVDFRFTKSAGGDEVHLVLNGVTIIEEYGPQVDSIYCRYFIKPVVKNDTSKSLP